MTLAELRTRYAELTTEITALQNRGTKDGVDAKQLSQAINDLEVTASAIESAERFEAVENQMSEPVRRTRPEGGAWTSTYNHDAYRGTTTSTLQIVGAHAGTVKFLADFARSGIRDISNAMSIGTPDQGGYEVPVQLDRDLQTVAANVSPLLRLAKVVDNATDGYRQNVSTTLPASAWVAEGGTRAVTASPTLAQIVPQRGAVAAVVQASQWVMQDADHDLYQFLINELGRQFGAAIGAAIVAGAAAQPAPLGLTAQTTAATADGTRAFGTVEHVATGGATTAPTLDHCITALSKLHPFYAENASWLMSPAAAAALMTQKASTAGSYMWQPDLSASQPPTLFGKPVFIDPNLPAPTTANALSVWLGDFRRGYVVVRYGRPILVRDDVTVKGQVLLYSEQRVGGNLVDSSAIKAIKTSV